MATPLKLTGYDAATTTAPPGAAPRAAGPVAVRITLQGEGFIERAMPLIVKIGDITVAGGMEFSPDQRQVTVYLDEMPEDGAVIRVGFGGDEQLAELPERFSRSRVRGGAA
jgi:hypothetical protein